MKEVAPGDLIFSFNNTVIAHIGRAASYSFESLRPAEFGAAGSQWDSDGWMVKVDYLPITPPLKPSIHMATLAPTLPQKYSPLQEDGKGNQVYLTKVPLPMANALLGLIGLDAAAVISQLGETKGTHDASSEVSETSDSLDDESERNIANDDTITDTERNALIAARKGQGKFRSRVAEIELRCRVTGVSNLSHRISSHIKPWSKSDNRERLDGQNGLLLAPHIDHLFDKGFISFEGDGSLVISPAADREALRQMGVPLDTKLNTGSFTKRQKEYLEYHRAERFKKAVSK